MKARHQKILERQNARVGELEREMRELFRWADGYVYPTTGMGSGLHQAVWPSLTPSAAKELRRRTATALGMNLEVIKGGKAVQKEVEP